MRPTIELSMIVKNDASGLARCLGSVQPVVDRIVVGDTGSTDGSTDIARSFGAVVLDVPWTDDFAAARNRVLARAECDWVLVLDADEQLDDSALQLLPALVESSGADAFQSWIWSYVDALDYRVAGEAARVNNPVLERARPYPAYFRTLNTRLFRRDRDIYFEHAVHESVLDRLIQLGRKRAHAPFVIHHFGYVEEFSQKRERKTEFYGKLSLRKAEAKPEDSRAQLEMGMHALDCDKAPSRALPYLEKAYSLDPASATASLYAGICYLRLNEHEKAFRHFRQALELQPENPLVHAGLGDLSFALGQYSDAREHFTRARQLGDASPLCLAKLGSSEVQLGFPGAGLEKLQSAAQVAASSTEILDMLAIAALLSGRAETAKEVVTRRLALGPLNAFGSIVAASVYLHSGCCRRASDVLSEALMRFPDDRQLRELALSPAVSGCSPRLFEAERSAVSPVRSR